MTVYIEYVLIDNFVIDYLLLKATFALTKTRAKKGRLLFCSFLGASFALVYPLITVHPLFLTVIKLLTGMLLTLIANEYTGVKHYYKCTVIFLFLTFSTGGVVTGVFELFNINASSELSIALMILPVYVALKGVLYVVAHIRKNKAVTENIYPCELVLGNKMVTTDGFVDTGNALYDGENPVIICERKIMLKLFGDEIPKIKRVDCVTVSGKTTLMAVELTAVKIYYGGSPNIIKGVTLAVTDQKIGTGYGVILHPALMESENVDNFNQTKRVS